MTPAVVGQVRAACSAILLGLLLAAFGAAGHGDLTAGLALTCTALLTTTIHPSKDHN